MTTARRVSAACRRQSRPRPLDSRFFRRRRNARRRGRFQRFQTARALVAALPRDFRRRRLRFAREEGFFARAQNRGERNLARTNRVATTAFDASAQIARRRRFPIVVDQFCEQSRRVDFDRTNRNAKSALDASVACWRRRKRRGDDRARFERAHFDAIDRTRRQAQFAAHASVGDDCVRFARRADDGVDRTRGQAQRATHAFGFSNHRDLRRHRRRQTRVERQRLFVKQNRQGANGLRPARRTQIDRRLARRQRARVGAAAGIAALPALRLRQNIVDALDKIGKRPGRARARRAGRKKSQNAERADKRRRDGDGFPIRQAVNPRSASDKKAAESKAMGAPRNGRGVFASIMRARKNAKTIIASQKPKPPPKP